MEIYRNITFLQIQNNFTFFDSIFLLWKFPRIMLRVGKIACAPWDKGFSSYPRFDREVNITFDKKAYFAHLMYNILLKNKYNNCLRL